MVIGATMCPHPAHRALLRDVLGGNLRLIYLDADHQACAQRDPKGLYRKSAAGAVEHFAENIFQEPMAAEVDKLVHTVTQSAEECVKDLEAYVREDWGV